MPRPNTLRTLLLLATLGAPVLLALEGAPRADVERLLTDRPNPRSLALPDGGEAFTFAVFGDRTGGPPAGVAVLAQAVSDVNLAGPDLVMTVGDMIQGYNETAEWLAQMREYTDVMDRLGAPWFPVAGNHDIYWRGETPAPTGEHEASYEEHFGPLWYAFRHKSAWFVVLYSDEGNPTTGEKSISEPAAQVMSPEQLAWLEGTLAKTAAAEHVFVFLHHPRWLTERYGEDWAKVHELLAGAGNVRAVFAGHIHHMRYDPADGIEYFTLATVGGHQNGSVPEAGYLHHYELVTVRSDGIDVVSYPVGTADDPRAITGRVSREARVAFDALVPAFAARPTLRADGSVTGSWRLSFENPVERELAVELAAHSADSRWRLMLQQDALRWAPGERVDLEIRGHRPDGAGPPDDTFRWPELAISGHYSAGESTFRLPERSFELELDVVGLEQPAVPATERVLLLDGSDDHLAVPARCVELHDGPFTLEGWLNASEFRERQGFLGKTENSEYGLAVGAGRPAFFVHLDGGYVVATADTVLAPGTWHHVAGVFDGRELRLFVDGVLSSHAAGSGERTPNGLPLIVGGDVDGNGTATSLFPGRIDEVRLSSVARYDADFTPARRFSRDGDTRLLLHMDGQRGPWTVDASGAEAHALLRNGARVGE